MPPSDHDDSLLQELAEAYVRIGVLTALLDHRTEELRVACAGWRACEEQLTTLRACLS